MADATSMIAFADNAASEGRIDALSNLNSKPVFIASGKVDTVVPSPSQYEQKKFYENYGANINFQKQNYGHILPTYSEGCKEYTMGIPTRRNAKSCGRDTVGEMFRHVLPNIPTNSQAVAERVTNWRSKGVLKKFD